MINDKGYTRSKPQKPLIGAIFARLSKQNHIYYELVRMGERNSYEEIIVRKKENAKMISSLDFPKK